MVCTCERALSYRAPSRVHSAMMDDVAPRDVDTARSGPGRRNSINTLHRLRSKTSQRAAKDRQTKMERSSFSPARQQAIARDVAFLAGKRGKKRRKTRRDCGMRLEPNKHKAPGRRCWMARGGASATVAKTWRGVCPPRGTVIKGCWLAPKKGIGRGMAPPLSAGPTRPPTCSPQGARGFHETAWSSSRVHPRAGVGGKSRGCPAGSSSHG